MICTCRLLANKDFVHSALVFAVTVLSVISNISVAIMSLGSVFITGANRGIGLEFVKQFLASSKPPQHVFATCRNPDNSKELMNLLQSNSNLHVLKFDVKDYDSFADVRKQVEDKVGDSGLNLLLNNAGIMFGDGLESVTREHMMENFEVNAVCPLFLIKEFLPVLKKAADREAGSNLSCCRAAVVNITSKMGSIEDNTSGGCYPYRTSKTALNMVAKSLSVDLKPMGILAFNLHPGWVITDMGGENALITAQTSVSGMINTIFSASNGYAGLVFNYDGKNITY